MDNFARRYVIERQKARSRGPNGESSRLVLRQKHHQRKTKHAEEEGSRLVGSGISKKLDSEALPRGIQPERNRKDHGCVASHGVQMARALDNTG